MPKRIQRKRTKGYRMPEGAVYVGRPTKWGNPFTDSPFDGPDAVERYRQALMEKPLMVMTVGEWVANGGSQEFFIALYKRDRQLLDELRGKDLACWCPLDKPCHADILLKIANE